jgi:hypothetical protein
VLYFFVLAGCGRIGFDGGVGTADAGGTDSIDAETTRLCNASAPFTSIRALDDLNDPMKGQGGLRMTEDELEVAFHSNRRTSDQYEIYYARRDSRMDPFPTPTVVAVGTSAYFPAFTADGLTLIYQQGMPAIADLRFITRATPISSWPTVSQPITQLATAPDGEGSALITRDSSRLYFVRSVGGSAGDIYVTDWPPTTAGQPVSGLGSGLEDEAPTPSRDEKTMYFSQLASLTYELHVAYRSDISAAFATPVAVPELDSIGSDSPSWLSADNCRLYFESTRDLPGYQLYVAERTP